MFSAAPRARTEKGQIRGILRTSKRLLRATVKTVLSKIFLGSLNVTAIKAARKKEPFVEMRSIAAWLHVVSHCRYFCLEDNKCQRKNI